MTEIVLGTSTSCLYFASSGRIVRKAVVVDEVDHGSPLGSGKLVEEPIIGALSSWRQQKLVSASLSWVSQANEVFI